MTPVVLLIALFLVVGIIGAVIKKVFRLAMMFTVVLLLVLGGAIFVIANMR